MLPWTLSGLVDTLLQYTVAKSVQQLIMQVNFNLTTRRSVGMKPSRTVILKRLFMETGFRLAFPRVPV